MACGSQGVKHLTVQYLAKFHQNCFTDSQHNYGPQAAGVNCQEKCCKPVTQAAKNTIANPSVHHKRILQKPGPQIFIADWQTTHTHKTEAKKYQAIKSCMYKPDCMRAEKMGIVTLDDDHIQMLSKLILHGRFIGNSWGTEGTTAILVIQRWDWNHRWNCNERQNNSTCSIARQRTKTATPKSHDHREDRLLAWSPYIRSTWMPT